MRIPPKYKLNPKISELVQKLEINRQIINSIPIAPEIEKNIRRESLLKSSLFSAQIEGNPLTFEQAQRELFLDPEKREKIEVANILKAINWLNRRFKKGKEITKKDILEVHRITMNYLISPDNLGKFRREPGAIFNQAGVVVYLAPPAGEIAQLINQLLGYINSQQEKIAPIKAALTHLSFEKIHPFLDGNGRVGRLLFQAVLAKEDYRMKNLVTIEEYLNEHRDEYYYFLDVSKKDATPYLEFFLEGLWSQTEKIKEVIFQKQEAKPEDSLLPRRLEILNIIRDHKLVSFDFIRRRFLKVNPRTLRYDLKKLVEAGFIIKKGKTKGVFYSPK